MSIYEFEEKLAKLAVLMANGKSESEEAFKLRDVLAELEYKMSDEEVELVRDLSSDLYMIEDDEIVEEELCGNYMREFKSHYFTRNYIKALEDLRYATDISPAYKAFYRSVVYSNLGFRHSALEFIKYARKINKYNPMFYMVYLLIKL